MKTLDPSIKNVPSYMNVRQDLLHHFPPHTKRMLDLGCNTGAFAQAVREGYPDMQRIVGLEINADAINIALGRGVLDAGHVVNLDDHQQLRQILDGEQFDFVLAGDVLEHLVDPWLVVKIVTEHLTPDGRILVSLPNIAHWSILIQLLRQSWPQRERGIFDNTHLRNFMRKDLELLAPTGYTTRILSRNIRVLENGSLRPLNQLAKNTLGRIPYLREYLTFQYIFEIVPQNDN